MKRIALSIGMCICKQGAERDMESRLDPLRDSGALSPTGFFFLSLLYPRITVKKMPPPRQAGAAKLKTRQLLLGQQRLSEARIELERVQHLPLPARQGGAQTFQW